MKLKDQAIIDLYTALKSVEWGANAMNGKGPYCPYCEASASGNKHRETCTVDKALKKYETIVQFIKEG